MPYFLDLDFYTQATFARSTLLSNALLPIPAHIEGWGNDFKTLINPFMIPHGLQLLPEHVTIYPDNDTAKAFEQESSPVIESFESDILTCSLEKDTEVIPNSFPESDTSSQFHLNSDIIKDYFGEGIRDKENPKHLCYKSRPAYLEEFLQMPLKGGFQPLEMPVLENPFKETLCKVLVIKVLLKRLRVFPVADPLLKPDNTPWMEKDLFQDGHSPMPFEVHSATPIPKEEFLSSSLAKVNKHSNVCMEELMVPAVKARNKQIFMDYIHNFDVVKEKLDCQQVCCGSYNVSDIILESFLVDEISIESLNVVDDLAIPSENIEPPLEFQKQDECDVHERECAAVMDWNKSPVFGLPDIAMSQKPNEVTTYHSNSSWKEMLEPFEHGEWLETRMLLTKKEYKKLKLEMWELQKHFDEERLPEPVLFKADLPCPMEGAKISFPITPEKECHPFNKEICELYQDLKVLEDPCAEVTMFGCDLELPKPSTLEKFTTSTLSHKDDLSDESINKDKVVTNVLSNGSSDKVISNFANDNRQQQQLFVDGDNPLESFMQFRSRNSQSIPVPEKKPMPKFVVKEETEDERIDSPPTPKSRIVKVSFEGPYEVVIRCFIDCVMPHLDKVKQRGLIPIQQSFYATSVDSIRFLLKETVLQNKAIQASRHITSNTDAVDLTPSLTVLLCLRQAVHLLIHSSLSSAITHITSFCHSHKEKANSPIRNLQQRLAQCQHKLQEENCVHPKFEALLSVCCSTDHKDSKILILVHHGLMSLVSALERVLSERTSFSVQFIQKLEDVVSENVVISFDMPVMTTSLRSFDLVVQYDASRPSVVKTLCEELDKMYVGFVCEFDEIRHLSIPTPACPVAKPAPELKSVIKVIGSVEMMQHHQLVCTLESRHNFLFIERNYSSLQFSHPLHYADVIFSLEVCMVLLPLVEIGTHTWDMETFSKRAIAMGLQTQHCFILVHGIGAPAKYLLDKVSLQNIYRLRAALSNLSRSSASFVTKYKILVALSQEDVSLNVKAIGQFSQSLSAGDDEGNDLSLSSHGGERLWIRPDMTQDEAFLLQFVCLNSFSSQLLLSKFNLDEILTMNSKQIKEKFSLFPENVLTYFNHLTSKLKSDQFSSTNSSPISARSISQKSACSTISNPNSEPQHFSSSPQQSRPVSVNPHCSSESKTPYHSNSHENHASHLPNELNGSKNTMRESICHSHRISSRDQKQNHIDGSNTNNVSTNDKMPAQVMSTTEKENALYLQHSERPSAFRRKENDFQNMTIHEKLNNIGTDRYCYDMDQRFFGPPSSDINTNTFDNSRDRVHHFQEKDNYAYKTPEYVEMNKTVSGPKPLQLHPDLSCKQEVEEGGEFFLGKSQSSPQNIKREIDDEDNSSFFLGKSQGSPLHPSLDLNCNSFKSVDLDCNSFKSVDLPGSHMSVCHMPALDEYNDAGRNGLILPEIHSSSSSLSSKPNILSSKPNLLLNSIDRLKASSHKPYSTYNTPSGGFGSYGLFSDKVGRRVQPLPISMSEDLSSHNTVMYNAPASNNDMAKADNDLSMRNSCNSEKLLSSNDMFENRYLDFKNLDHLEPSLLNKSDAVSNITQLPFVVSKDLKRHIKQTNSCVFGKDNRWIDVYQDGVVYSERISRKPFVLRDKVDEQVKDIRQNFESQNLFSNNGKWINDHDRFSGNKGPYSLSLEDSSRNDHNQLLTIPHQSPPSAPQHQTLTSETWYPNLAGSDLPLRQTYNDKNEYRLNNIKPVTSHSSVGKENILDYANINVYETNQRRPLPFEGENTAQKQQQFHFRNTDHSPSNIGSFTRSSTMTNANGSVNEKMKMTFNTASNQNMCLPFANESSEQKQANPVNTQHSLNQSDFNLYQRMHCHEMMKRDTTVQEHGSSNEPTKTHYSFTHNPEKYHNRRDIYLDRSIGHPHVQSDLPAYQQSHGSMDRHTNFNRTIQSNTNKHEEMNLYRGVNNWCQGREQERVTFPTSNGKRAYNLPYTPRRTISVGLAQPLQRHNAGSQENQKNSAMTERTTDRPLPKYQEYSSSLPPPVPPVPSHSINITSSPPMDLGDLTHNQHGRQSEMHAAIDTQSAQKMRKWNSHLQRHVQHFDECSDTRDQQSVKEDSSPRRKRLCMERTDGNKGQMVLAFK